MLFSTQQNFDLAKYIYIIICQVLLCNKRNVFLIIELINVITCEDVLSADMCKKLRAAAELFKIKAAEVDKMIRQAIAKGVTKAKEIFKIVQAKLIEMAKNFKCTDALSKDVSFNTE